MTRAVQWNSMEFHGTWGAPISLTRAVPWISWNLDCANFADTGRSVEFHGIPWNLECDNFDDMSSSMEFHKTWGASISLTRAVPWYSRELRVRQFRWQHFGHRNTNMIRSFHRVIFPLYYIRNKMGWTDMSKRWYPLGCVNTTYFLNKGVYNQLRSHINWFRIMNKGKKSHYFKVTC